ncbi:MAG TPA: NAD(P)-dependent oxidoreductase [Baekduia sp.]|nr:NAD(P)-dependent oxidoreductase [Baekduia sp.]
MARPTLVTGGAGYLGMPVVDELSAAGRTVRVLDVLLHDGQAGLVGALEARGVEVIRGDVRDPAVRRRALEGIEEVVHLAAIVGDPACARDPELAEGVNVEGTTALVLDARGAGVRRFVFASTCSNYGRLADPTVPIDEDGELSPISLYARQKVAIERALLNGGQAPLQVTCLRLATLYGVAPRMRFDLTVNEFTRDLWAGRRLEVFGEQFWRPYVHVRDAGRAIRTVLEAPGELVAGKVFNVGRSGENYRKLDLVELIRSQTDRGTVSFVHRSEDPRDYKVSFDRIAQVLGFRTAMTVADGVAEIMAALDARRFADPFGPGHTNIP